MGQRLNVEVAAGERSLICGNCYYHWSAYTHSTLLTVQALIHNYYELIKDGDDEYKNEELLLAAKMFQIPDETIDYDAPKELDEKGIPKLKFKKVMAGLTLSSQKIMKFLYPFQQFYPATDRNVGLIGISPFDVGTTRNWEEGKAHIDLKNKTWSFDVYWEDDEQGILEWRDRGIVNEIPEAPDYFVRGILDGFRFEDIDSVIELVDSAPYGFKYKIDDADEYRYIQWIE